MTLRNEIISVKELSKKFVSAEYNNMAVGMTSHSIQKTVINSLGYQKVIGLQIQDIKNDRFDASRVGTSNYGMKYIETEFVTITNWIYE